jgi:hypothetical protein
MFSRSKNKPITKPSSSRLKRQLTSNGIQGVIYQKVELYIIFPSFVSLPAYALSSPGAPVTVFSCCPQRRWCRCPTSRREDPTCSRGRHSPLAFSTPRAAKMTRIKVSICNGFQSCTSCAFCTRLSSLRSVLFLHTTFQHI